jgi:uncharacterized protein YlxW (UPF0749 family)
MVQAHAHELLNQKEGAADASRPIYAATQRLATALDRLERSLQHVTTQQDRDVQQHALLVQFERENAELHQERNNLDQAITQLKSQYDDLHQVANTIYGKLDDSIKRLTQIVGD